MDRQSDYFDVNIFDIESSLPGIIGNVWTIMGKMLGIPRESIRGTLQLYLSWYYDDPNIKKGGSASFLVYVKHSTTSYWHWLRREKPRYYPVIETDIKDTDYINWWAEYYYLSGMDSANADHFEKSETLHRHLHTSSEDSELHNRRWELLAWTERVLIENNEQGSSSFHTKMESIKNSDMDTLHERTRARIWRTLAYVHHRFYKQTSFFPEANIRKEAEDCYSKAIELNHDKYHGIGMLITHSKLLGEEKKLGDSYTGNYHLLRRKLPASTLWLLLVGILFIAFDIYFIPLWWRAVDFPLPNVGGWGVMTMFVSAVVVVAYLSNIYSFWALSSHPYNFPGSQNHSRTIHQAGQPIPQTLQNMSWQVCRKDGTSGESCHTVNGPLHIEADGDIKEDDKPSPVKTIGTFSIENGRVFFDVKKGGATKYQDQDMEAGSRIKLGEDAESITINDTDVVYSIRKCATNV